MVGPSGDAGTAESRRRVPRRRDGVCRRRPYARVERGNRLLRSAHRDLASRAPLAIATSGAAAAARNGVTIVAGGESAGETSITGIVQSSRAGVWRMTPMLLPRHGTTFAVFRGRLWACGGATAPGFHAVPQCTSLRLAAVAGDPASSRMRTAQRSCDKMGRAPGVVVRPSCGNRVEQHRSAHEPHRRCAD